MNKKIIGVILALSLVLPVFAHEFTDIDGHWAESTIINLYEQKIIKGISETEAGPDQPLKAYEWKIMVSRLVGKARNFLYSETLMTREDAIAYLHAQNKLVLFKDFELIYTDAGDINSGNLDAIKWATNVNLVKGNEFGEFMPKSYLTRAEAMTIVERYMELDLLVEENTSENDNVDEDFNAITSSIENISNAQCEVTVSWGEKPTGGYAIEIVDYEIVGDTLVVTVKTTSPRPGDVVTQAFTYPKDSIVIFKGELGDDPTVTIIEQE